VLAHRLSADPRRRVLLLEAGPRDRSLWIHLPIGYGKTMFHPVYNWGFRTEPEPHMNERRIYWPRGRGLGGSSSINGLIVVHGQPQDYDAWAAAGNDGWAWKDVQKYFARSRMSVSPIGETHELMEAIIAGANELGIPRVEDFNGPSQEGVGYYQLFTKDGFRSSSAAVGADDSERSTLGYSERKRFSTRGRMYMHTVIPPARLSVPRWSVRVSAITQTPASGPRAPVTTPPMSSASIIACRWSPPPRPRDSTRG